MTTINQTWLAKKNLESYKQLSRLLQIYVFYSEIASTPNHVTKSTLEIKIAKTSPPSYIFQIVNGSNNY